MKRHIKPLLICLLAFSMTACGASVRQVIPTERPTTTATLTTTMQPTTDLGATQTAIAIRTPLAPTGGPSPTPLFGPTRTPSGDQPTATRVRNPNAPRIEFFRADNPTAAPGDEITLFWSTRNVVNAVIYRLDENGQRTLVYNIPPDGSETIRTSTRDRGQVEFLLVVGEGGDQVTQSLRIPLLCPITWFFQPSPEACPNEEPQETIITVQDFERGRMFYVAANDTIYTLFNDGRSPAWTALANRYDPAIHPEFDESFERALVGTGFVQPLGRLGFVWRGNDTVRNRLGNGTAEEINFDGFLQTAPENNGRGEDSVYISSNNGTIVQLLPEGSVWQIITPF